MQRNLFFTPAVGAAMALSAAGGDKQTHPRPDLLSNVREHVGYVVWSAGAAAGTILIESAHDPAYTGAWSLVGTLNFAASTVTRLNFTGYHRALRFRCSADVTGGNATGYFGGN